MKKHIIFAILTILIFLFQPNEILKGKPGNNYENDLIEANFEGKYRKEAKTSFAYDKNHKLLEFKKYANLKDLIKTLPSDTKFEEMHPEVTNKRYYPKKRYEEELQNVEIEECWLYFTKIEDDNDFHIIIGSSKNSTSAKFFNIEVSGLPTIDRDKETIRQTRDYFISNFPVLESYNKKPILKKVKIKGSLFFDGDHKAGQIGTQYAKPKTVWEIHPVYSIEILN